MSPTASTTPPEELGYKRSLTAPRIALLIIAGAAPLGVVIGNVPVGILLGNGIAVPVSFLIAGILITSFVVGFIALSQAVPGANGFASLAKAAFGSGVGLGTAYTTALAYVLGTIGIMSATGYFAALIASSYGFDLPWWVWSFAAAIFVALLGRRAADLSAKVLFLLIVAEFAVVIWMDLAI